MSAAAMTEGHQTVRARAHWLVPIIGLALAAIPALIPFTASAGETNRVCIAAKDAWGSEIARPDGSAFRTAEATLKGPVPLDRVAAQRQLGDPQLLAVDRYLAWRFGPGACMPGSRHRLAESAAAALVVGVVTAGVATARRRGNT